MVSKFSKLKISIKLIPNGLTVMNTEEKSKV